MLIRCDMEIMGVPGEKLIKLSRIETQFETGFTIVTGNIYANLKGLTEGTPMQSFYLDVADSPEPLKSMVLQAAYGVVQALKFPTGTIEQ